MLERNSYRLRWHGISIQLVNALQLRKRHARRDGLPIVLLLLRGGGGGVQLVLHVLCFEFVLGGRELVQLVEGMCGCALAESSGEEPST